MRLSALLAPLILAPPLVADVVVVDPAGGGDHTTVAAAVAAAQDGDVVLVLLGTYTEPGPLVVDAKSLSIVGENHPTLPWERPEYHGGLRIENLAADQRVVLDGLFLGGFESSETAGPLPAVEVLSSLGHVRLQNCVVEGGGGDTNAFPNGAAGVRVSQSDAVAIVDTTVNGGEGQFSANFGEECGDGGPALRLTAARVALHSCWIRGGGGGSNVIGAWPYGGRGGSGAECLGSELLAAGTDLSGGDGGIAHEGGDGGDGLVVGSTGSALMMAGSDASGGSGGWSDAGPDGLDGMDVVDLGGGVQDLGGLRKDFTATTPVVEGQPGVLDFDGWGPLDAPLLLFGDDVDLLPLPSFQGIGLVSQASLSVFAIPGPGTVDLPFTAPTLPAGTASLDVFMQAAYFDGSVLNLGPGYIVTILDGGL